MIIVIPGLLMALIFAYICYSAIKGGKVRFKSGLYSRKDDPLGFFSALAFYFFATGVSLIGVYFAASSFVE